MTTKAIVPRARARQDVEEVVDYYLAQAGADMALGFVEDLQQAYALIARHPSSGSLRYAYELTIPNLRTARLKRFPYLIFYNEQPGHVDVWRVLHSSQNIPEWLQSTEQ
ncbi:type II toxin-antitoxin system RelE/ParE family toxin [Rhizobium sp. KVB221]|uniref:Type II toxin-antitoxin system RelE/ParE family toxin n=1 Tax=Rhizobium setariae TaxID=2801340 RepID=A0A937CNE1_9HYPH|nr:type II toxin-antitoxin system RelE/ParE family toxin [Rhizobium setariae]